MMENYYTWIDFISTLVYFAIGLLLVAILYRIFNVLLVKNSQRNFLKVIYRTLILMLQILMVICLVLIFLGINIVLHSLVVGLFILLSFPFLRNYVFGIEFKWHQLVKKGTTIIVGKKEGEIKKFLLSGLLLKTPDGERFISYNEIKQRGYLYKYNSEDLKLIELNVDTLLIDSEIIEILSLCPLVHFSEKPIITSKLGNQFKTIHLTIERGVQKEEIIKYFNHHQIKVV